MSSGRDVSVTGARQWGWWVAAAVVLPTLAITPRAQASCGDYVQVTNPRAGKIDRHALPAHEHGRMPISKAPAVPCPCSGPTCSQTPPVLPSAPSVPTSTAPVHDALATSMVPASARPVSIFDQLAGPASRPGHRAGIEHPPR
jgi:hypothetical protein